MIDEDCDSAGHGRPTSQTAIKNIDVTARNEVSTAQTGQRSPAAPNVGENKDEKIEPTGNVSESWSKCADAVWKREKNKLDDLKESINNLLIFSGLFSAILTAFIVPFYGMLQTSPPDASAQALIVISLQLEAMSGQLNTLASGVAHINVTQPIIPSTATLSPAPPTPLTTISTCILWLMALVCSLGAAMIGIVVSQWLQRHGDPTANASRLSIRIWYFRDQGFIEWKVQGIIDTLPLLLQISVVLFLVGLVQLLFTMNVVVAAVVTALVAVLLSFSVGTALIPAFAPKCPYKSPQAWWCFLVLQWFMKHPGFIHNTYTLLCRGFSLIGRLLRHPQQFLRPISQRLPLSLKDFRRNMLRTYSSWRDFEYFFITSRGEDNEDKFHMMVHADEILMDESSLLDIIIPYVKESNLDTALPTFYAIMQRRAHETRPSGSRDWPDLVWYKGSNSQLVATLADMAISMLTRVKSGEHSEFEPDAEQAHILRILQSLSRAMPDTQFSVVLHDMWSLVDVAWLQSEGPIMVLLDMTVHWFVRPGTDSHREAVKLHVSENLERLFKAMSDTQSATVIDRLCSLLDVMGRSRNPIITLGDMTVDIFDRIASADGYFRQETEQLCILRILDRLLSVMPRTGPAAAVYLRLWAQADAGRLSDDMRKKLAELIVVYYPLFKDHIEDIRPILSAISSLKDLDPDKFSWGVFCILDHSAKLPEFEEIHDELRGVLAAVARYFSRPNAMALADRLNQALLGWGCFYSLTDACVELAKADSGLFTPRIVAALEQFSLLLPDQEYFQESTRDKMKILLQLTGQGPSEVIAADLPSASGTDS